MALEKLSLPTIPLRDVVVYPFMIVPLFVGRKSSIKAIDVASETDKRIFLVLQKEAEVEQPTQEGLYSYGVLAKILQVLRLPDGTMKVLVEGLERAEMTQFYQSRHTTYADIKLLPTIPPAQGAELEVLMNRLVEQFEQLAKVDKRIAPEVVTSVTGISEPDRLADCIAGHLSSKLEVRQKILETLDVTERLNLLCSQVAQELDLVVIDKRLQDRVRSQVEKNQRSYYLNEKIKAIQQELGEIDETGAVDEFKKLEKQIKEAGMSAEALEKAEIELGRLKMMPPMSAEATVSRNYLEWLISVPWQQESEINQDLAHAKDVLDKDHYSLEKIKDRILEYLAVQQRVRKMKGPILCLVGPPGVGKTSLGKSIAEATGREFIRFSLGGVRDEAEIRGHRRTYIGALPGKIMQKMAKAKVKNPLFMLDEVDKMAMDFRGDPASALLEVLDPEQNNAFNDHFMEVDYDLSNVMFIATANSLNIPAPLLDRMEVIRLAGYTEQEKVEIAQRYLLPKQIKASGLKKSEMVISKAGIREIIRSYTREAGVRNLDREIAKICRKVVKKILLDKNTKKISISQRNLEDYLGVKIYRFGRAETQNRIGQVTGLAWTQVGGEILSLEAQVLPGKGLSSYTGSLGDVMQESIKAAMTVVRSRSKLLGMVSDYCQKHDVHVHVPEGATPKDGPSAGIGMCTAIVSAITQIPVKADVAMTGEITLRGEVLPIGGLKEKLLAALRAGIKHVIIPKENEAQLKEIDQDIIAPLTIHPVRWIDQVWEIALTKMPKPLVDAVGGKSDEKLFVKKTTVAHKETRVRN